MDWSSFFLGLITIAISFLLLIRIKKKHDRIDTESIAQVVEVKDIGRVDGKRAYAIRYKVMCSEPFDIVETPCKKPREVGKQRVVFYEKADVSKERQIRNFYFKTIKHFDRRFIAPCLIMFFGVMIFISTWLR